MLNFYAQIVGGGLVVGISQLSAAVNDPSLIPVDSYDDSLIGMVWNGTEFVENPDTDQNPETVSNAVSLAQKALAIKELPQSIKFLDTEERGIASVLFPEWRAGLSVAEGEIYRDEGRIFEVRQAHTTQDNWRPTAAGTAALWTEL